LTTWIDAKPFAFLCVLATTPSSLAASALLDPVASAWSVAVGGRPGDRLIIQCATLRAPRAKETWE
jgi:hypothetical protein